MSRESIIELNRGRKADAMIAVLRRFDINALLATWLESQPQEWWDKLSEQAQCRSVPSKDTIAIVLQRVRDGALEPVPF